MLIKAVVRIDQSLAKDNGNDNFIDFAAVFWQRLQKLLDYRMA